jgi:crossover junction endodeoxyribonuclease RusA
MWKTCKKMNKITLPWPPKQLSPNARVHWAIKARIVKKYRADCYYLARQENVDLPKSEKIHLFVDFYQPDRRRRDQDNIEASMKAAYDGVADALLVNDSRFIIHPFVKDEIVKGGKVTITITGQ